MQRAAVRNVTLWRLHSSLYVRPSAATNHNTTVNRRKRTANSPRTARPLLDIAGSRT
jgi:hypothetical protein